MYVLWKDVNIILSPMIIMWVQQLLFGLYYDFCIIMLDTETM